MKTQVFVKHSGNKITKKSATFHFLLSLLLVFVIIAMVVQPEKYIAVSLNSLLVWASVVLPSIFPFLLYSRFLSRLGLIDSFAKLISPITKFLFNTDGISAYIYLISIMSGYPVGAKLTADLFLDGRLDRGSAARTITYCATSGPMFIIGTVGVGMLISKNAGYVILISHFLGALLNGILFRNHGKKDTVLLEQKNKTQSDENYLYTTAIESANSMLIVGAYIVLFFILIEFLNSVLILNDKSIFTAFLNGFLEITHGAKDFSLLNISLNLKALFCTIIISFGGVSTLFQSMAFLKKINFNLGFFILCKITHTILSGIICFIILQFITL